MYFLLSCCIIVVSKHLLEKSNMKLFQNLSKKNILRIAIVVLILCWIFVFDANFWVGVFAQTTQWWGTPATTISTWMTGINIIDWVLQIIYMIFYPLIFLAGLAMDNSLVYWEVFHLDVPLWKFRNIIKNLANFTLWFLVLFTILKNVFSIGKKVDDVKKVVTNTLIAGVLIQASWFLTAALIDISTIATYGIWALPMSVLEWTKVGDQKILAVDSVMDIDKSFNDSQAGDAFKTAFRVKYWPDGGEKKDVLLAPCKLKKDGNGETYIIWRKYYDYKYQNYDIFWKWKTACIANSKEVVIYNEFPTLIWLTWSQYENVLGNILGYNWITTMNESNWSRIPRELCGYVIPIKWKKTEGECWKDFDKIMSLYSEIVWNTDDLNRMNEIKKEKIDVNSIWMKWGDTRFQSENVEAITISQLVDRSKWLVWPMMTIFSSMMNFAQISEHSSDNGVWAIWMETLIKAWFAIAIFFPLLALTLLLVARVGVLRLVVAGSPFIILLKVFKDQLWWLWDIAKKADLGNIIKLIFSPVIIVFALSMSIIFMQTLISGFNNTTWKNCDRQKEMWESMMITPIYTPEQEAKNECKTDEYVFLDGLIKVKANWTFDWSGTWDLLSRTMVNLIAVALVWLLVFAAFKATWSLGESIWKWVESFGRSVLGTMPIMPVWWWEKVWLTTWKNQVLWTWNEDNLAWRKIKHIEQESEAEFGEKLKKRWIHNDDEWSTTNNTKKNESVVNYITTPTTTAPSLNDLNAGKADNEKITADYMTKTDTLLAIETEIKKNATTTNENINRLSLLLNDAIKMKLSTTPTKKEDLDNIFGSILSSNDAISKKFLEDFITKTENNFTVLEGANNMIYKIEKNNGKFELKWTAPTTPTTP